MRDEIRFAFWVGCIGLSMYACEPRVIDVSGQYKDRGVFGRRFETKIPLLVTESPSGFQLSEADITAMPRLEDVKRAQLPYSYYGRTIHGILEEETAFEIVGALRSTSSTMGEDYFMVKILSGSFEGKEVGALFLKPLGTNDVFDPKLAVEVVSPSG